MYKHRNVGDCIVVVKPGVRVLNVMNNAEVIVLVLGEVSILHCQVGISVDMTHEGHLNNGLRGGCDDHHVRMGRRQWMEGA